MYILRFDYQNGLHKEYVFNDLGAATTAYQDACVGRKNGVGIEGLYDEAGRRACFDGGKLQSIELVDLEAETISGIRLLQEVQSIQNRFNQRLPQPAPMVRDDEPEYRAPAIGTRGKFAS